MVTTSQGRDLSSKPPDFLPTSAPLNSRVHGSSIRDIGSETEANPAQAGNSGVSASIRSRLELGSVHVSFAEKIPQEAQTQFAVPVLSVVVPVYNEEEGLPELHRRLTAVMENLHCSWEIIYVDDGSSDRSAEKLLELRMSDTRVALVNLSRNFGKEIALTAGLDFVRGQAAVVIDADLQDPPEVIALLVERWRRGYDMVYATRRERKGETWLKRTTASLFYRVIGNLGETEIPENTGDFRLVNRRCIDALQKCRERRRFMKGLFAWVGFKSTSVAYDRDPRFAGTTKWNYWRLWNFALEGLTSFTTAPLKVATYFGLLTAVVALCYAAFVVGRTILVGREVPGYASLMVTILFLSGVQLIALGVVGEYVSRIFIESKGRPLYLIDTYLPPGGDPDGSAVRGSPDAAFEAT
jgi:polyisoprenyl-phosphate glycosyltransferase